MTPAPGATAARGITAAGNAAVPAWLGSAIVLFGLLAIAAILRLAFLDTRGTWDADQGHDMSVLRAFVRDGVVPLLGPPTSIGDVHHGALYYYLLAPAAALTGGDSPLAVTFVIALCGIAAVGVTWWLARDIGGPVAGLVAGIAMAVSATAVDESTFIWNPNLIALSSAVALAAAWQAWTTTRPRWWQLAAVGTAVTIQCHVLGVTLLPIVAALFVADLRSRRSGSERRAVWRHGLLGAGIVVLSFAPLVVHELTSDFSEVGAALAYLRGGGDGVALAAPVRALVVGLRVLSWPLTGLITDGFVAGVLATGVVIGIAVILAGRGTARESQAARWLGAGLAWTIAFLTFASPSLATVVPGLPNDHYHAFADPMVFVLLGLGAGALWRLRAAGVVAPGAAVIPAVVDSPTVAGTRGADLAGTGEIAATSEVAGMAQIAGRSSAGPVTSAERMTASGPVTAATTASPVEVSSPGVMSAVDLASAAPAMPARAASRDRGGLSAGPTHGRVAVVVGLGVLLAWNVGRQPPAVHPDGGFPAADRAATRIADAARGGPLVLRSLPGFKSTEAYAYPLARAGMTVRSVTGDDAGAELKPGESLVVICDALFTEAIGGACGGPAEAAVAPTGGEAPILRFEAAPGRFISVYPPSP